MEKQHCKFGDFFMLFLRNEGQTYIVQKKKCLNQGAKKVSFTACHSGKLLLACTSQQVISTSHKTLFD